MLRVPGRLFFNAENSDMYILNVTVSNYFNYLFRYTAVSISHIFRSIPSHVQSNL